MLLSNAVYLFYSQGFVSDVFSNSHVTKSIMSQHIINRQYQIVCMCIYGCLYIDVCMYVCIHTYVCMYVYACACISRIEDPYLTCSPKHKAPGNLTSTCVVGWIRALSLVIVYTERLSTTMGVSRIYSHRLTTRPHKGRQRCGYGCIPMVCVCVLTISTHNND